MEFFLPIAEVNVSLPFIFFLSLVVGILSGLFGVGGGFLMTPFLIFLGIPPAYAVPNEANNILGTSVSGALTHWFRKTLDYKMGLIIVFGGVFGTIIGMIIFRNIGDEVFSTNNNWTEVINLIEDSSKVFLTMAMAAIGLSTNLKDIKNMGYKPFVVGFVAMITVGIVSILTIEIYLKLFI